MITKEISARTIWDEARTIGMNGTKTATAASAKVVGFKSGGAGAEKGRDVRRVPPSEPPGRRGRREIDVEDLLVWTYHQHQTREVLRASGSIISLGFGTDSSIKCERNGVLGTITDYSGRPMAQLPPDAESVHDTVMTCLDDLSRTLLIEYGEAGIRPEAYVGRGPRFEPVINGRGTISMLRDGHGNAIACRIEWTLSHLEIEFARSTYAAWIDAMVRLIPWLNSPGCLDDYFVVGPRAPSEPWLAK